MLRMYLWHSGLQSAIKVEVQTVDFATLMSVAGTNDYDILAVQYTYAPVDPYPDVAWLLGGEDSWTGYGDDSVNEALAKTQTTSDMDEIKGLYSVVDSEGTGRCSDVLCLYCQRTGCCQQTSFKCHTKCVRFL